MRQTVSVIFLYYISKLNCFLFNRRELERAIRDSLILAFAKPYIVQAALMAAGLLRAQGGRSPYSMEVSPSRMAYFVRSAMLWRSSFFMSCRRWVSMVLMLT